MMKIERKESDIEAHFIRACQAAGWLVRKLAYPGRAGAPDRIVYARSPIIVLAELKRPGEDPEPLQRVEHADLAALGHWVAVVRTEADIKDFVDSVQRLERGTRR